MVSRSKQYTFKILTFTSMSLSFTTSTLFEYKLKHQADMTQPSFAPDDLYKKVFTGSLPQMPSPSQDPTENFLLYNQNVFRNHTKGTDILLLFLHRIQGVKHRILGEKNPAFWISLQCKRRQLAKFFIHLILPNLIRLIGLCILILFLIE